ncbi:hypothetical protein [Streptomyces sp. NPDC096324]|uniref:hypothetical protein n=1 Tax=Streptomyces sp. NPDC096324 TaxID=3366085 RepID=UPI003807D6C3
MPSLFREAGATVRPDDRVQKVITNLRHAAAGDAAATAHRTYLRHALSDRAGPRSGGLGGAPSE